MQRPPAAAQFVQGPPIIYATPQPYQVPLPIIQQQQMLMDNVFHDQARICQLEQQLDITTRKISEVIGNHELLSCRIYSLNEVVQNVGKVQDEQKANAVQKQNSANEILDMKKEIETAKSWSRSLEADLARAQAEKQQMKEALEFQKTELERVDRLYNSKSKLLYKETKDNGDLRRQVRSLQEQLERFIWEREEKAVKEEASPANEQSGWRSKEQVQRIKSTSKFGGDSFGNSGGFGGSSGFGTAGFGVKPSTGFGSAGDRPK